MARTTDRQHISEAVRKGDLWRTEDLGANYHVLITDYDEQLEIFYGNVGQIRFAIYQHWNRDTMETVSTEDIRKNKRQRVLELINQKDVNQQ